MQLMTSDKFSLKLFGNFIDHFPTSSNFNAKIDSCCFPYGCMLSFWLLCKLVNGLKFANARFVRCCNFWSKYIKEKYLENEYVYSGCTPLPYFR